MLQLIPIIEPNSTLKICWDIFVLIAIVINLFYIPMDLSFNINDYDIY